MTGKLTGKKETQILKKRENVGIFTLTNETFKILEIFVLPEFFVGKWMKSMESSLSEQVFFVNS